MGVTNRNEVQYKNPEPMSSTESLHIPMSGANSRNNSNENVHTLFNLHANRHLRRKTPANNDLFLSDFKMNSSRYIGKRREKRLKAIYELEALIDNDDTSEVYLEENSHKSSFAMLMENTELDKIWTDFIEDNIDHITNETDHSNHNSKQNTTSYNNITWNIRMALKMMRNLYELTEMENEIVEFFSRNLNSKYTNDKKTSFQRLLIHGIAQYYCLKSSSFDDVDGKRVIQVWTNNKQNAFSSDNRLATLVESNRNKYNYCC